MGTTAAVGAAEGLGQEVVCAPGDVRHLSPVAILNSRGMILECNEAFETLFGMAWGSLGWQHISMLFPELDADEFALASKTCPMQDYLVRCGRLHRGKNRKGEMFSCNLIFAPALHDGDHGLRLTVIPSAVRSLS